MHTKLCLIPLALTFSLACADDGTTGSDDDIGAVETDGPGTSDADSDSEESGESEDSDSGESEADSSETQTEDSEGESDSGEDESDSGEDQGSEDESDGSEDESDNEDDSGDEDSSTTGDCLQCGVTLDSTQSSSFEALPGTEFMGYATLEGDQIIYALDEVDAGRVIYTADTNLLYTEITDCPMWEWLGQSGEELPNVLSFGRYLCDGVGNNLGNYPNLTYAGDHLPPQYVGNPAQLAADYDAVIYCTLASTSAGEAQTIVDYVTVEGGGLYLASEYWGFLNQGDVDAINTIANPLGVDFKATNLDWGQANGDIEFDCFPEPQ